MKTRFLWINLVLIGALLLAGCGSRARVGTLQTESQSVELGEAGPVSVEINLGAGNLNLKGGAEKLLEADFNYNVDRLKPEVKFTNGKLVVWQPDMKGMPSLRGITDFRNEWGLRLNDDVPMDLRVDMGGGFSTLQLADISLTRLDVKIGAGVSTIDLSGGWVRDLDVTIDTGAADITVRLPRDVGVRVVVNAGPTMVDAQGLTKDGGVYTNAAYGVSNVTLQVNMQAGIGQINLEVEEAAAAYQKDKIAEGLVSAWMHEK